MIRFGRSSTAELHRICEDICGGGLANLRGGEEGVHDGAHCIFERIKLRSVVLVLLERVCLL